MTRTLSFKTSKPQSFDHSPWHHEPRLCRFKGKCVVCGRRTYAFDDGQSDPRGPLGDHAASPLYASEYGMTGPDVPACFPCMNEEPSYRAAVDIAKRRWQA